MFHVGLSEYFCLYVQVDSGYNTTSAGTASLIDGLGSDFQGKESLNSNMVEEAIPIIRQAKIKVSSGILNLARRQFFLSVLLLKKKAELSILLH